MYRILKCVKDNYLVYKYINGRLMTGSNIGQASTLDLYCLKDETIIPGVTSSILELTRGLLKFDLMPLTALTQSMLNINSTNFRCELQLFDVYGGQTIPSNYSLEAYPLSKSFDEGRGKDVIAYRDLDSSNWLTASSINGTITPWTSGGADYRGTLGTSGIDIITSGNLLDGNGVVSLQKVQEFTRGDENFSVDVTRIVSATLVGTLPDNGYRVSYIQAQEQDSTTRFVKRFATRHVSDTRLRPKIIVKYDDSEIDDTSNLFIGASNTIYLRNIVRGQLTNILSGTSAISGSNSLLLTMTLLSGTSAYSFTVTGSQKTNNSNLISGTYYATFNILNTLPVITGTLLASSSLRFASTWKSLDGTVTYQTQNLNVYPIIPVSAVETDRRIITNITNLKTKYSTTESARLRVFCFDSSISSIPTSPQRLPLDSPSIIFQNMYYRVLDAYDNQVVIPFDSVYNSTRLSTDKEGMYFTLFMSDFDIGSSYRIEFLVIEDGRERQIIDPDFIFNVIE